MIYLHCIFLFTLFADLANEFDSFFVGIDFIVDKGNWIVNEMEDPVGTRMLYQTSSKNVVSDYVNEMILKYGLK